MSNEINENEKTTLTEDQLSTVAGGNGSDKTCWFKCTGVSNTPAPPKVELRNGEYRMWCAHMICNSGCACWGTNHCIGAWHLITNEELDSKILPLDYSNHNRKNNSGVNGWFKD